MIQEHLILDSSAIIASCNAWHAWASCTTDIRRNRGNEPPLAAITHLNVRAASNARRFGGFRNGGFNAGPPPARISNTPVGNSRGIRLPGANYATH